MSEHPAHGKKTPKEVELFELKSCIFFLNKRKLEKVGFDEG